MAECTHSGKWQEDILGKTCLDCGFNTLHNDYGMYNESKPIGLLSFIKKKMEVPFVQNCFLDYVLQKEFEKAMQQLEFRHLGATIEKMEELLMPSHVYSKRKRLDFLLSHGPQHQEFCNKQIGRT
jgi:hypothetical protein